MKNTITFTDNSDKCIEAIRNEAIAWLHEASGEIISKTQDKSRRATGKTAGSFDYKVDTRELSSTLGSPEQNAIWEEFGTGEYALYGNGRKGGWKYQDKKTGKWYFTRGKTPTRAFYKSYKELEPAIKKRAEELYRKLGD